MTRINLLISHKDEEYATALSKALAIKDPIYAITIAGEEELSFQSAISEAGKKNYDLILLDQEWKEEAERIEAEDREKLIGLSEIPSRPDEDGYIYKYGGLERIDSDLQLAYAQVTGKYRIHYGDHKTRIIGFTSSAGGVGTSSIAIAVGRELTALDKRDTLYLSFERTESTSVYISVDEGRASINEYLYYLFTKEKEASSYIDGFLISDVYGLLAFRPSKVINELTDLTVEQQLLLIDSLCAFGRFRYIVIDFCGLVSDKTWNLMMLCCKVFLIDDGTPLSVLKNDKFIANIPSDVFDEIKERIYSVTNKWRPRDDEIADHNRFYIEYDEDSFQVAGSNINISLHGCFGLGVKRIADELTAEL
ncbi:MAG: hypothetical protein GXX92_00880 [Clostridiales bacterium]|nr:hypothetical protein [Clostridiales bacterium]